MRVGDRVDVELWGKRWGPATVVHVPQPWPLVRQFIVHLDGEDRMIATNENDLVFLTHGPEPATDGSVNSMSPSGHGA